MKLSVKDLDLNHRRVLVRVDFNVPLKEDGSISDPTRITASLPTIEYILKKGGSPILLSHLGRPEGKRNMKYSLAPCAHYLESVLHKKVQMAPDCVGEQTQKMVQALKSGEILMLENLRFHGAEEHPEKDPAFTKELASFGEVYVNDAFGTAHRAHSSTALLASYFPGKAATGFLMEKEIEFLGSHLKHPARPFYALIGGAKVSTKIKVLSSLLTKVDALFIGGGMAYTFLKACGLKIGDSIHEEAFLQTAKSFLEEAKKRNIPVYLPEDLVIANHFSEKAASQIVQCQAGIPSGWQGMDLGRETLKKWKELLKSASLIFWNGPLGVFEMAPFAHGTNEMAKTLATLQATTIVGGGDSVAAIAQLGLTSRFTHISTGGGASLEYIEKGSLPGIEALSDRS